jgi:hypothetical protein
MTIQHAARTALATITISLVAAAAAQATTLSVNVDSPAPGTPQSPQAHTTNLAVGSLEQPPGGNPKSALVTLTEQLPADFAVTLGGYASCTKVIHGDNKPDCPDSSIVGTASGSAFVPALLFHTTSDRGFIYKISDQAVRAWIHFSSPQQVGVVVTGTLGTGAAPFGPTISWDFKAFGSGAEAGVEVRVNSVGFVFTQQTGSGVAPPPAASPPTTKQLRATCSRKARRIKDKHKRKRALQRCAKLKARKQPAAPAPQSTQYSALSSTGCSGGSWPFRVQASFADGATETADATAACTAPAPASPAPAPKPPSPLCPPVCTGGRQGANAVR